MSRPPDSPTKPSVYRMNRGYFLRALGLLLAAAAVAVVLTSLALQFGPGVLRVIGVVMSTVFLIFAFLAAASAISPPALLHLDEVGFRANKRQVSGRARARWDSVTRVGTQSGPQGEVMIIEHTGGALTAVPLSLVDEPAAEIEADVQRRLDTANGYRRLS